MENYICNSYVNYVPDILTDNEFTSGDSSGVYICKSIVNYLRHGKLHM